MMLLRLLSTTSPSSLPRTIECDKVKGQLSWPLKDRAYALGYVLWMRRGRHIVCFEREIISQGSDPLICPHHARIRDRSWTRLIPRPWQGVVARVT
jgi:hypothetical protein